MADAFERLHIHPKFSEDGAALDASVSRDTLDVAVLTRRLTAGDESAYRVFYDAYFDRLSRYLLVVTAGHEDAARDALQETFHRVVRHIRVFSDEAAFWSWLTVLARSARTDECRKRRRYLAFLERFTQHSLVEHAASSPDHREANWGILLEHSMHCLSVEERALLELKYFEHRSVREIAQQLQTSEKAIESRLVRARRNLKQLLLAELKHESPD